MPNDKIRYFNLPVELLNGFLPDTKNCLDDICDYAIYDKAAKISEWPYEDIEASQLYFNVKLGDPDKTLENGRNILNSINPKSAKAGLNMDIFWDFYKYDKSEFEKVCLLAFLGIKSILQNHACCKITNRFLLSRMSGSSKLIDLANLPPELQKYNNEYQLKKIKTALRDTWGLTTYSRYTRGFWVSFKMTLDDLVFEAEKRKKANKQLIYKKEVDAAIEKALIRLNLK